MKILALDRPRPVRGFRRSRGRRQDAGGESRRRAIGRYPLRASTPSGYFQLARKETTRTSVIAGTLTLPPGAAGRGPAMIISHGSGGS